MNTMTRAITFHTDHIEPIKEKDKRLTIRHGYENEHRQGDSIKFMDPNHLLFGSANVLQQYTMTVKEVINTEWEYHYSYSDLEEFRERFNAFYPDVDFEPQTELTVIEWGRTFTSNWEYF